MTPTTRRPVFVVLSGLTDYQIQLLRGITPVLNERGLPLMVHLLGSYRDATLPPSFPDVLRSVRPVGAVITTLEREAKERTLLELFARHSIPVSTVGMGVSGLPGVRVDNTAGMRELMAHLLDERGVRRPMLVRGIPYQQDSVEREGIFRQELTRRGLPVQEHLVVDGGFSQAIAHPAVRAALARDRGLDAVVALNDLSAMGAINALSEVALRVPENVLLTGFDNDRAARLCWPPLTTVDQDLHRQGAVAAEQLLRAMAGSEPAPPQIVPSRLVVRGSTGRISTTEEERDLAIRTAADAQSRFSVMDAAINVNAAMQSCRTVDEVVQALLGSLDALGFRRLFLALRDKPRTDTSDRDQENAADERDRADVDNPRAPGAENSARLVLAYRDGTALDLGGAFPLHHLLPPSLRPELAKGLLAVQPLRVGDKELGYLMMEPSDERPDSFHARLTIDIGRALDAVLNNQERDEHARELERQVAARTRELRRLNAELERSLLLDGLTGIANRTAFDQYLDRCLAGAPRSGPVALLMVDVDMFKAFNDRYGHLRGDNALRDVASCLARAVHRSDDLACRYGGEEFAVVLPDTDAHGGRAVAERFREYLASAAIPHDRSPVAKVLTASVGLAVIDPQSASREALIEAADSALYRAKAQGRNCIVQHASGDAAASVVPPQRGRARQPSAG